MIHTNPEIELIVNEATGNAKAQNHEYVTLEHIALSLINYKPFNKLLADFGVEVAEMQKELVNYIASQHYLISKNPEYDSPKRTHALERVFNRAFTQVLFSGRSNMQVIDLFLSVASENNSFAQHLYVKYGMDRQALIGFYQKNYSEAKGSKA